MEATDGAVQVGMDGRRTDGRTDGRTNRRIQLMVQRAGGWAGGWTSAGSTRGRTSKATVQDAAEATHQLLQISRRRGIRKVAHEEFDSTREIVCKEVLPRGYGGEWGALEINTEQDSPVKWSCSHLSFPEVGRGGNQ